MYPKRYTRAVACSCEGSKSCRHKRRFFGMNIGSIGLFHVICMFPTARTMNEASSSRYKSCSCSDNHCIALTHDGRAFTWALTGPFHFNMLRHKHLTKTRAEKGNKFGQLCASPPSSSSPQPPTIGNPIEVNIGQRVAAVGAGGSRSAGHTALVGLDGALYMCGCDRWQQLGLSMQKAGLGGNSAGYTWDGGRIWQSSPQRVAALGDVKITKVRCSCPPHFAAVCAVSHAILSRWHSGKTTAWRLMRTSALCMHGAKVKTANWAQEAKRS